MSLIAFVKSNVNPVASVKSDVNIVEFVKSNDCDFAAVSLSCRKFKSVVNTNLPGKFSQEIAPYFDRWCAIQPQTSSIILIPELVRVFKIFSTFENREEFKNWLTRFVKKNFCIHYEYRYCCWHGAQKCYLRI